MAEIEREIKLLNVNPKAIMQKMKELGVEPKWKYIQDIYTFDFPTIQEELKVSLEEFNKTEDKRRLTAMLSEIYPCFSKEERKKMQYLLGGNDLLSYINEEKDMTRLSDKEIQDLISEASSKFKKWIRLRTTGNETTITIKKIINADKEYQIDDVEELEIPIPNIDSGKELLQNLGYFPTNHQRKLRIAYDYANTEVVLDKWPKIPPYVEIEGQTKEDIIKAVKDLGYKEDDIKVMNTDAVYALNGINLYDFTDLDFDENEEKQVESLLNENSESKPIKKHSLIAISGMPAAGKTSVSKKLVSTIPNLVYFDFGAFFRPITFYLMKEKGLSIENIKNIVKESKIEELMENLDLGYRDNDGAYEVSINGHFFENNELYNPEMDKLTVDVGTCFGDSLNGYIKNIVENIREKNPVLLNARRPFAVCDDISNHIFLKADFQKRAMRKAELNGTPLKDTIEDLRIRDEKEKKAGFWKTYPFTKIIDTTDMEVDDTTELVKKHILEYTINKENNITKGKEQEESCR